MQQAATAIAVTSAPNPSTVHESVTFTATVTISGAGAGIPTGWVTFTVNSTVFTATLGANGIATAVRGNFEVGTYTVNAAYTGDANFARSTIAGVPQVVQPLPTAVVIYMPELNTGNLETAAPAPEVTQPDENEPAVDQPEVTQPDESEPAVDQPEVTQPDLPVTPVAPSPFEMLQRLFLSNMQR